MGILFDKRADKAVELSDHVVGDQHLAVAAHPRSDTDVGDLQPFGDQFGQLGDPENQIDISVIFMLSVTEPSSQVYLLQSLVEVYKEEALLLKIQAATDPDVIVEEVNAAFTKVQALKNNGS